MSLLATLFDRAGSDKGTQRARPEGEAHHYAADYERLVPREIQCLLELGVGCTVCDPHAAAPLPWNNRAGSIRAWLEWCPEAQVWGVDYDLPPADLLAHDRFHFIQGDLREPSFLAYLASRLPEVPVIIDDASHQSTEQWLALEHLWPKVAPGGIYVLEDTHLRLGPPPWPHQALPHDPRFEAWLGDHGHGIVLRKDA